MAKAVTGPNGRFVSLRQSDAVQHGELTVSWPRNKGTVTYLPQAQTAAEWAEAARLAGLRLPIGTMALTTGGMERWLRKIDVSAAAYLHWGAYKNLADFGRLNPTWTLRSWAGLVIEHRDQIKEATHE